MHWDVVFWFDQEFCHMVVDDPHVWTLDLQFIKVLSKKMPAVDSSLPPHNRVWRHCHTVVVNSADVDVLVCT